MPRQSIDRQSFTRTLESILPLVSKPSRYLGNEFHVVRKHDEEGARPAPSEAATSGTGTSRNGGAVASPVGPRVDWCLVLPEVYEIGMSHWGLKILYEILNGRPDSLAERCYAPWFDMEAQLRRHGLPLYALESKRPLHEFDIVGYSLQYELTYTNVLQCLDLGGIPLRAEDRGENDPLVAAGGPVASNPEPLSDFIDFYLIGDGEDAIHRITEVYRSFIRAESDDTVDAADAGGDKAVDAESGVIASGRRGPTTQRWTRPRREVLRELSKIPGVYVPLMYEARYAEDGRLLETVPRYDDVPKRVLRQFVVDLENAPTPKKPIVPLQEIVQDRLSVEVLRGCTQGCRFCQAGYLYRPIRERSVEKVVEIAEEGLAASGWDEIGLTSLSTADYTQLEPLADVLNARFGSERIGIALPSLRADSFGVEVADKVKETKRTGFTFAPEVGSERLRLAVNKLIRDEEFFQAAHIAYSRGWRLIKMYFMVGLPTETDDDVEGIVHFINTVRSIGRQYGRGTVNASIGAFVPKSHTPFQWDAFEGVESLQRKIKYVRERCHSPWSRVKWHDVRSSHLEAVFSMGDRRLGRSIEWAYRQGARFDGWTEHFDYGLWMRAFAETGIDPDHQTRARGFDEALPWDHIDIRVSKKWLERERKKTSEAIPEIGESLTADCRHGDCTACGIPNLPFDTQLTPALDPEKVTQLVEDARRRSSRREDGGMTWPVRVHFRKVGLSRFLSHLEMGTVLQRAFRMAKVPVAHTQGHVPHPKFAYGPSLSVGIESEAEAFDVELLRPWNDRFVEDLNRVLPQGMEIVEGTAIQVIPGVKRRSLQALARRARYEVELQAITTEERNEMRRTIEAFGRSETCVVERTFWTPQSSREIVDWESPSDPLAVAHERPGAGAGSDADERFPTGKGGNEGPDGSDANEGNRGREGNGGNGGSSNGHGRERNEKPVRMVDLRKAISEITLDESGPRMELELFLAREDGQVANPRVLLERLFRFGPESQARIRVVRTELLTEAGQPIVSAAPVAAS
ncbi:MAG: TIGR03960 family B12-binding radical SAM protein [Candidatus Eisenbacteria bacterium]|uniref:TIGR03960 family B12-binding radical SAM protein n=1 Tax=Eiseniibacteriota bacterium TaxID=2212470 RepID=A0A956LV35_UNCEI|nr:TIGR03960 family B12-binding radical SAM protein [Candidatus Eisenbacteria bacterium]